MCKKLMKWANKKVKKLTMWDISNIKTISALAGIIIGAYICNFVKANVWYFAGVAIVLYLILLKRVFK